MRRGGAGAAGDASAGRGRWCCRRGCAARRRGRRRGTSPSRLASSSTKSDDPAIAAVTPALPPHQANSGLFSAPKRLTSWVRPERIGADRVGVRRVEHRGEAGDAALDDLLEHDVGLVEPGLRAGVGVVVDLDHQRRARRAARRVGDRQPGERHHGGRRGRGRCVVVGHRRRGAAVVGGGRPWSWRGRRSSWTAPSVVGEASASAPLRGADQQAAAASGDEAGANEAGDRMRSITALSAGRSAPRAAGGCRTVG